MSMRTRLMEAQYPDVGEFMEEALKEVGLIGHRAAGEALRLATEYADETWGAGLKRSLNYQLVLFGYLEGLASLLLYDPGLMPVPIYGAVVAPYEPEELVFYDVVLHEIGDRRLDVVKALKFGLGYSLNQCTLAFSKLPTLVKADVNEVEANDAAAALILAGAKARVRRSG